MPGTKANRNTRLLAVAILSSFVAFLDGSIVTVALPAIGTELGGGLVTQQWTVNAYLLTLGALILLAGSLSDTFGRLRILRLGLLGFGAASLACALAWSPAVLIIARAVQGMAGALLVPGSLALITTAYRDEARARAIGQWTAWTGTAAIIGPLLGGVLVDWASWRWIFAVNVLPVTATLLLTSKLQDTGRLRRTSLDLPGALLAVAGLAGPVYALIEQERLGWADPAVVVPLVAGTAALVLFFLREARAPAPMMPLSLFRARNFRYGNLVTAFAYGAISLGSFAVTVFVQEAAGFSAIEAGFISLPLPVAMLLFSTYFGKLSGRYGPRLFMTAGPAICGAGFLLLLTVQPPVNLLTELLPGLLLFGVGLSVMVAPLTAAVLGALRGEEAGIGSAVNNAVSRVAGLVAVALVGTISGGALGYAGFRQTALATAGLFFAAAVIALLGIRNPKSASVGPSGQEPPGSSPQS
ncbi:MFS transporter [Arthrobacter sp. zg-Y20]|uniref:MFS transporter n=1 Tax=unclassified Arthrobacter TaxID=235627 RepID=UPI001D15C799|nr:MULTISPECIES: MFS transporter [unclassified Arthrobacter]MCC3274506.1 MFS transporter [Arthrobacter sp. zg-Y20]MDK1314663.1 MFS transporter [Arthrobacter sp. zg.Y20]WIB07644.1 MFS transporter [Arthrobacter sp. zg-Y20]